MKSYQVLSAAVVLAFTLSAGAAYAGQDETAAIQAKSAQEPSQDSIDSQKKDISTPATPALKTEAPEGVVPGDVVIEKIEIKSIVPAAPAEIQEKAEVPAAAMEKATKATSEAKAKETVETPSVAAIETAEERLYVANMRSKLRELRLQMDAAATQLANQKQVSKNFSALSPEIVDSMAEMQSLSNQISTMLKSYTAGSNSFKHFKNSLESSMELLENKISSVSGEI